RLALPQRPAVGELSGRAPQPRIWRRGGSEDPGRERAARSRPSDYLSDAREAGKRTHQRGNAMAKSGYMNRRQFIQTGATVGAVTGIAPAQGSPQKARRAPGEKRIALLAGEPGGAARSSFPL